jgi:dethiobiotin synthetase
MRLVILGTDTDVGKTWVTATLVRGLRAAGRRVWIHKPVACGEWDGASSADGRTLRALCGDGQDPATVCPREFPEPCSPHLAAAAAGVHLTLPDLIAAIPRRPDDRTTGRPDLLLETAGGLLAPLTHDRLTNADLVAALGFPALLVTRPHLGTLNHTQLTVNEARRRGIALLGLVVNYHGPTAGFAADSAPAELVALTGLPLLAVIRHQAEASAALAAALLAAHTPPP